MVVFGNGEVLLGPAAVWWREAMPVYNRCPREVPGGREEVGWGRSSR